jgi:hypothetical protein
MRKYDVALSYASPERAYAAALAKRLSDAGLSVFFDSFEQSQIVGKRLTSFLQDIFANRARYCVVLISQSYASRVWPRHEIQAALGRAVHERREYILPVRLDATPISGLPQDLAYIDANTIDDRGVADLLVKKIKPSKRRETAKLVPVQFDRRGVLEAIPAIVAAERNSIAILTRGGFIGSSDEMLSALATAVNERHIKVRIVFPQPAAARSWLYLEAPIAEVIADTAQFSIARLRRHLTGAEIRLMNDLPSYSAVVTSSKCWYLPQLHSRGAFDFPVFTFGANEQPELYEMVRADFDRVWSLAS